MEAIKWISANIETVIAIVTAVVTLVPEHHRGQLMGRIAIVMSVAPALGPIVSGLILQWLDWRWLFIFVLPIAITALVLGILRMPNVGEQKIARIDLLSVCISILGFGGVVYGLSAIGERANGGETIEPAIPACIGLMNAVSQQLFAAAAFSLNKQRSVSAGKTRGPGTQTRHGRAVAQ